MVRVIHGSVVVNSVKYSVGKLVPGLSEKDEVRLVSKGVAEFVVDASEEPVDDVVEDNEDQGEGKTADSEDDDSEDDDSAEEPAEDVKAQSETADSVNFDFDLDEVVVDESKPSRGRSGGKAGKTSSGKK